MSFVFDIEMLIYIIFVYTGCVLLCLTDYMQFEESWHFMGKKSRYF